MKTSKQLERHLKGVANHHRIDIIKLIEKSEGVTLDDIANRLDANLKTIGEHTRRLYIAGLIDKKYKGRTVTHSLSPYGKIFCKFLKTFSLS